jgi:hypothetical protein
VPSPGDDLRPSLAADNGARIDRLLAGIEDLARRMDAFEAHLSRRFARAREWPRCRAAR